MDMVIIIDPLYWLLLSLFDRNGQTFIPSATFIVLMMNWKV